MKSLRLCLLILLLPTLVEAAGIAVFAASSLTEVLREAAQAYEHHHPGVKLQLHFAGSQALATQIEQGAPADLFIAANTTIMERLHKNALVEKPRLLLANRLVLAVRPDLHPAAHSIADLARPGLLLVVGNAQVPVGSYTRQLFNDLAQDPEYGAAMIRNIEQNVVSQENRVKAIIAKLLLGEVDAGIVYQSDLSAENARRLIAIPLPEQQNPRAAYPLAKVTGGSPSADSLIAFLCGEEAQLIFARHGFLRGDAP